MAHNHQVHDDDKVFIIDPVTRIVKMAKDAKPVLMQFDHNSEHITFECDRFVEEHDLTKCDKVEVHYINTNGRESTKGIYPVEDLGIVYDDKNKIRFTWILSQNTTMFAGSLSFIIAFTCTDEGDVLYRWNTRINTDLAVSSGINNTEFVEQYYADILEMWKQDLFGIADTEEARMRAIAQSLQETMQAKGDRVVANIPDDYTALAKKVDDATWTLDATDNKVALECTEVRHNSSFDVVGSVISDGYNNVLKWNAPHGAYTYTYALIGKYSDFKNKLIRVVLRNESENAVVLNEMEIVLSGRADWGDIPKFKPIPIGKLENGAIVTIDINVAEQSLWETSKSFTDDTPFYFIIRDQYNACPDNNNIVRFFCSYAEKDKYFSSSKNLAVYRSLMSDEAGKANFATEAGIRAFESGSCRFYKNYDVDLGFGRITYDDTKRTARFTFAGRTDVAPNSQDSSGVDNFWAYGMSSFNITDLIGKGVKIYLDLSSKYYSDIIKTLDFRWFIGPLYNSWGSAYKAVKQLSSTNMVIDIDGIEWDIEPDTSVPVYFGIGYNVHAYPNDSGVCSTPITGIVDVKIGYTLPDDSHVIATELKGFDPTNHYTKEEVRALIADTSPYITCWGDSLTAGGGWTTRLSQLTGMTVYNGGTGGEAVPTIVARQGADAILLNNITIPADTSAITLATRSGDTGLTTELGNKVAPLLQSGAHVNPCKIGDVLGTLKWTGSNYSDTTGTWTFTRQTAGDAVTITRPTALRTDFDMNKNSPYLMVIFIGQNGGYNNDPNELIRWHRLMIEHAHAKNVIVLGLSSGSASSRAAYETAMREEFGRYFISLREYLSAPIRNSNGDIVNCYGLEDQGLTPTAADLEAIASGTVPASCLSDSVHYTSATKTVIGDLIYRRCRDLNIF